MKLHGKRTIWDKQQNSGIQKKKKIYVDVTAICKLLPAYI